MVRVVVMVAAIAAFFSAAVLFGGNAVGAWDDANIPPDFRRALHPRPKEHRDASQPAKKAKPKRHSQSAEERWVARVERLCARATADTILLPAPQSEREALAYLERLARMNARYNGA